MKSSVASKLVEHQWEEVAERNRFYPALRRVLTSDPLDIAAVFECVENQGKTILGGHMSFHSRVKDFFTSGIAAESLNRLLADRSVPPPEERIDDFIQSVIDHGFPNPKGKPAGGDAVYLASVLLTAVFSGRFRRLPIESLGLDGPAIPSTDGGGRSVVCCATQDGSSGSAATD